MMIEWMFAVGQTFRASTAGSDVMTGQAVSYNTGGDAIGVLIHYAVHGGAVYSLVADYCLWTGVYGEIESRSCSL